MTNYHGTWGRKLFLVGENRDNNSRQEEDTPDEEDGEPNAENLSAVVGLKKSALMQIFHFCSCCRENQPMGTRTCGYCMMVHQHIFRLWCLSTSMLHITGGGLDRVDLLLCL
ncbi:hypothetical protein TNCV_3076801 [Trichonephila clavipes]|nr:hypothetical protein TNCV_3076801 [Trichonephila clavipes]